MYECMWPPADGVTLYDSETNAELTDADIVGLKGSRLYRLGGFRGQAMPRSLQHT